VSPYRTLAGRLLLGSTVLGAVVSVVFALLVLALDDLRAAADREAQAKDAATLTLELQKLVLDLETGLRGFAITGDERFLEPWRTARAQLGPALDEFVQTAEREAAAREIAALVDDYLENYSVPLVAIARESPAAARSREARSEGRRRIEDIRQRFARFIAADSARVRAATEAAGDQADRAIVLGLVGLPRSAVDWEGGG
jgi:CHASE3 domain sensor protein